MLHSCLRAGTLKNLAFFSNFCSWNFNFLMLCAAERSIGFKVG